MPNDNHGNVPEPNFNTRNSGNAYQALSKSLAAKPEAEKLAQDETLGTLDDHVDITDPDYNESEAKDIERQLAAEDGVQPLPEDAELKTEEETLAIEEPSAPDPF